MLHDSNFMTAETKHETVLSPFELRGLMPKTTYTLARIPDSRKTSLTSYHVEWAPKFWIARVKPPVRLRTFVKAQLKFLMLQNTILYQTYSFLELIIFMKIKLNYDILRLWKSRRDINLWPVWRLPSWNSYVAPHNTIRYRRQPHRVRAILNTQTICNILFVASTVREIHLFLFNSAELAPWASEKKNFLRSGWNAGNYI